MTKSTKMLQMLIAFFMTFSLLAGCSGNNGGNKSSPAPAVQDNGNGTEDAGEDGTAEEEPATEPSGSTGKDSLIVALSGEPPSITTCEHDSLISVYMNLLTFNGLTRIDHGTLQPELDLAESYDIEDDIYWIFKLKEGVLFHNGDEMTADDVAASIEWAKTFPASLNYTKNIAEVEAVDNYTVKITTDGPYAGLLYDLGYHFNFIVPKSLIEADHDFNMDPIGTGPYKMTDWNYGNTLAFESFDDYFDADRKASIKHLQFNIIPEGSSRTFALEAGEIDFIYDVATADVARLESDDRFEVSSVASVENFFLMLHKQKAPFDDANLRNAINYAINREDIVTAALNSYGVPNYTAIAMGYWGSTEENAPTYDLEKAQEYLDAWGGDPATVNIPIICSNEIKVACATVIQSNLAQLGITVEIVSTDTASYFEASASGEYISYIASWSPSNSLTYVQRYHSDRNEGNPGSLVNDDIDAMVTRVSTIIDDNDRLALIEEIVSEVNLLAPQPSLYQPTLFRIYDANLGGVVASATGYVGFNDMYWK